MQKASCRRNIRRIWAAASTRTARLFCGSITARLSSALKQGGSDEEVLDWCFANGRRPADDDIAVWNEFMRKRGWNDEITEFLVRRKKEAGMAGRSEIRTMFEFIDVDEGRPLPDALGVDRKPPRTRQSRASR